MKNHVVISKYYKEFPNGDIKLISQDSFSYYLERYVLRYNLPIERIDNNDISSGVYKTSFKIRLNFNKYNSFDLYYVCISTFAR